MMSSAAEEIVGRGAELGVLRRFVENAAEGSPSALEIHGEVGIGKTVLWRDGVARCRARGYRVLTTRCSEEEMTGALVGLVDLFEHVAVDSRAFVAETDPQERGRHVLDAVRRTVREAPVVLGIDDLQWLDAATARALRYVMRRLEQASVAVLATARTDAAADDPLALASALPPGRVSHVGLGPLTRPELRRMLDRREPISPLTLRTIHQVSGGNPLYALELARSLSPVERGIGVADSLPLPKSLQGAMERRLALVGPGVLKFLETLAAVGPVTVEELETETSDIDTEQLIAEAERLGFVITDENLRIRFAHPVLASAVHRRINPRRRRRLHARLAETAATPDARARHLALSVTEPEAEVASVLEEAAERARRSGAPGLAAEFARHSVRLTPSGDDDASSRRTLLEMTALAAAGEIARARDLVDQLVASLPSGPRRAEALIRRFYVENDEVDLGDATLVQALAEASDEEILRGQVLDILGWHRGVFRGDLPAGIACAVQAVAIATRLSDQQLRVRAEGHLAHMKALSGHPDPEAMARSLALAREVGGPHLGGGPQAWLAKQVFWAGNLDEARTLFDELLIAYAERGYELERPYRLYDMSLVECAAGNLDTALAHANSGIESAQDAENTDAEGWLMYPLALAQAWLGLDVEARATADRLLSWPGRPGNRLGQVRALSALGLLRLSTGEMAVAATDLARAIHLADSVGLGHPGALAVVPDGVIAFACAGRIDEARRVLAQLDQQAAALDQERTSAMLHHARGVVLTATGEPDAAIPVLTEATEAFDRLRLGPDAARCRLAQGRAALRAGRRTLAADLLDEARRRFMDMGARHWAAAAAAELERAMPGRTGGVLTPTETRIARLVAQGAKNAEIASELFVSVATVEAHLTRVYRKLDMRSRTELARAVLEGTVVPPSDDTQAV